MKNQTNTPTFDKPLVAVDLPPELKKLHDLCKLNSAFSRELALEKAQLEHEFEALIARRGEYMVEMEHNLARTLAGIEDLVRQHPEWLGEKRSLKTPHGTIKLTTTSALSIADEMGTLNKLLLRGRRVDSFDPSLYYRDKPTLDLESLEKLDDKTLERLGVIRVTGDKFSFKLTVTDLKKALADAASASQPTTTAA